MNIGLYGGSFDPIHHGHIRPVREARDQLELDRVIYLPTANPPHKSPRAAPALARYAMVELALLAEERFRVSTFELGKEVAYTVDTLEHVRAENPAARLILILGGDSLPQLDRWRRWRRILEIAELGVLERPGEARPMKPELASALDPTRVHRIANAPVAASSSEVRRLIAAHDPAAGPPERTEDLQRLVPPLVLDYIRKYRLYA